MKMKAGELTPTRSAIGGAIGFGVGLAAFHAAVTGVDTAVHIPNFNAALAVAVVGYAIAGAIGGYALGLARGRTNIALTALAAAIGLGVGNGVGLIVESAFVEGVFSGPVAFLVVDVVRFAFIGALTGLLLGLVRKNAGGPGRLIAIGTLGFGLTPLVGALLDRVVTNSSAVLGPILGSAIYAGIFGAMTGLIGGAALGLALDWHAHKALSSNNSRTS